MGTYSLFGYLGPKAVGFINRNWPQLDLDLDELRCRLDEFSPPVLSWWFFVFRWGVGYSQLIWFLGILSVRKFLLVLICFLDLVWAFVWTYGMFNFQQVMPSVVFTIKRFVPMLFAVYLAAAALMWWQRRRQQS
jgi:hypothetical protein